MFILLGFCLVGNYLIMPSGNLQIANATQDDEGPYKCAAYNPVTQEVKTSTSADRLRIRRKSSCLTLSCINIYLNVNNYELKAVFKFVEYTHMLMMYLFLSPRLHLRSSSHHLPPSLSLHHGDQRPAFGVGVRRQWHPHPAGQMGERWAGPAFPQQHTLPAQQPADRRGGRERLRLLPVQSRQRHRLGQFCQSALRRASVWWVHVWLLYFLCVLVIFRHCLCVIDLIKVTKHPLIPG